MDTTALNVVPRDDNLDSPPPGFYYASL